MAYPKVRIKRVYSQKERKEAEEMTHTVKESLRWFGVIMIYGRLRKNTYGASFFLPKDSDKVAAYKVRQNWRVFWKPKALKVRTIIEEYYWTKGLMEGGR